jgi:hypothetical protein
LDQYLAQTYAPTAEAKESEAPEVQPEGTTLEAEEEK